MKRLFGVAAVSLLVPGFAAAEFAYTGFEVSFVDVSFDAGPVDIDGDGYRFEGSIDVSDSLFLRGELEEQSYDFDVDGSWTELGVGFHHPLNPRVDLIASGSYVKAEVEAGGFDYDDDGLGLGGGIRARVGDVIQVETSLKYVNFDDGGSDTGIELRGRYYFTDRLAVGLRADFIDNFDTWSLGFRAEF